MLNILEKVSCLLKILPGALSLISFEVQGEKGGAGWWGWERESDKVLTNVSLFCKTCSRKSRGTDKMQSFLLMRR